MILKILKDNEFNFNKLPADIRTAFDFIQRQTNDTLETSNEKLNMLDKTIFDSIKNIFPYDLSVIKTDNIVIERESQDINDSFNTVMPEGYEKLVKDKILPDENFNGQVTEPIGSDNVSEREKIAILYGEEMAVMADGGEVGVAIDKMIAFGMAENNQSIVKTAKFIGDFDLEKDTLIKAKYEDLKYWVKKAIPSKNYEALPDWRERLRSDDPKDFVNRIYWESHGDVVGRIPKYTATVEKQLKESSVTDPELIAWGKDYIKRLKDFIPVAIKFDAMKSRIGKKEVSKEAKENQARQDAYAKIYSLMPSGNKDILSELVKDITKSFKPFEDEIYERMDERYRKLIKSYMGKKDAIKDIIVGKDIKFYDEIFDIEKKYQKDEKVMKKHRGSTYESWERYTYLQGFSKKDGWEKVLDSKIKSTIEGFRVELLLTIMEKFEKITEPIAKYKLLDIKSGYAGFEGAFEFKFKNGSSFIFETQAIVAGGYNIQIEHLRYISHFKNAILSNGKKLSDPHLTKIVENFSIQEQEPKKEKGKLLKSRYIIGDKSGAHTIIDVVPYVNKLAQRDEDRFLVSASFIKVNRVVSTKTSDRPISSYDEYISDMVNRGGAKKMEKGGEAGGDSFTVKFSRSTMHGSVDNLYNGIEKKLSSYHIKFHSDKTQISFNCNTNNFGGDDVRYAINKYVETPIYATQLRPELKIDYKIISGEPSKKDIVDAFEILFDRVEDKKEIEYEEGCEDYDPSVEYWIVEKNKMAGGGEVSRIKESIEYLNRAPHARLELYFDDESRKYPQKGKPNSLVSSTSRGTLTGKRKWEAHDIVAYDNKGKIVGVLSILTKSEADEESVGAFKIVVRDDARMKGWATKLLDRAEEDGIDMIEAVRHNNYSSRGRWMIRLWLEKKLESDNKMGNGGDTENMPVKELLKHLYKEHHDSFAIAKDLEETTPLTGEMNAERVIEMWDNELDDHFKEEEERIFPRLIAMNITLTPDVNYLIETHNKFRNHIIPQVRETKNRASVIRFASALKEHILDEEKLFRSIMPDPYREITPEDMEKGGSAGVKKKPTSLLAPNGKPSNLTPEQYNLVRTPEFISWFGDWEKSPETSSKVVDENVEPLICYHGSVKKFNEFKDSDSKYAGWHFFASDKDDAIQFAENKGGETVVEFFLNVRNPVRNINLQHSIQKELLDKNKNDGAFQGSINWVVISNSNQAKLADGSNKAFDGNNPDIRFDAGGEINENNYFQNTKGEFEIINKEEYDSVDAEEFVSEFESRYKTKDGMLYRGADHWGEMKIVRWNLKNKEYVGDSFEGELDAGLDGYDKPIYAKILLRSLSLYKEAVVDEDGLVKVWVSMRADSPSRAGITPFIEVHPSLSIDDVKNVVSGKYPDYAYFKYRGARHA
jgi:hypothetical protein